MRDTRLLSLAVLAVALGFAAPALGDIAVATLIIDPDGAVGEWESKIRLWSELGPNTEASGLGFLDFVLVEVSGTVAGGKEVNDSANVSPTGTMQPVGGGVQIPTGLHKVRRDGWETGAEGVGLMAAQWWYRQDANNLVDNYAFARADANAVLDQAVLPGIGVSDNPGWTPPDAAYENVGPAPSWQADTKIATGTYLDGNGAGTLRLQTEGNLSFSVLEPSPPDGNYHGPSGSLRPLVSGTVTQVMVGGTGNEGGRYFDRETVMTVVEGTLRLRENTGHASESLTDPAVPYVHMNIGPDHLSILGETYDAFLKLDYQPGVDSNQDLLSLSIDTAASGRQALDLNSPDVSGRANIVRIYSEDLAATEAEMLVAVKNAKATGRADGIIDSGALYHIASEIGVTDMTEDPNGVAHVTVRLTLKGDTDCDGDVDFDDLANVLASYNFPGTTWDQGDTDHSGATDFDDLADLLASYNGKFAPEPATMALLAFGGLALLRRRRRR